MEPAPHASPPLSWIGGPEETPPKAASRKRTSDYPRIADHLDEVEYGGAGLRLCSSPPTITALALLISVPSRPIPPMLDAPPPNGLPEEALLVATLAVYRPDLLHLV